MINYDDFQKLDIRIGTILEAEKIENADKLLKLKVDLGPSSTSGQPELRVLVAGIAESYKPQSLINKQIPILINLEPRTLRGVESQGMILACVVNKKAILLKPIKKVPNGTKIK
ncbi:MAG TPA: methionine--tRNA ligase [Candidatus Paceibacterota bacterium]|nr:methionine--tRNA ligase [Candidatus Paceibacterota bacterium]